MLSYGTASVRDMTEDKQAGGHVLDCALTEGTAAMDITTELDMLLPQNKHFSQTDLSNTPEEEIKKVESNND
jgi:alpha-acetolactate decarboxylase